MVTAMAQSCDRPIIMPLSNPTSRSEAHPADLLDWTDGRALIATGSPYGTIRHDEVYHTIAQANNALIFPGLGLGVSVVRATRVSDEMMIHAAADALAGLVNEYRPGASLLPSMSNLRLVSSTVAIAVAQTAEQQGLARTPMTDPINDIYQRMWKPEYPRLEASRPATDRRDERRGRFLFPFRGRFPFPFRGRFPFRSRNRPLSRSRNRPPSRSRNRPFPVQGRVLRVESHR
ncbi:MAG: malic enzyme-like NAD(P)-binding protein [Micropruina sp.]